MAMKTYPERAATLRVGYRDPLAAEKICSTIINFMALMDDGANPRAVLCIGSDRSTGDALGPLVGTHLLSQRLPRTVIYGTLAEPVHAVNLEQHIQKLEGRKHSLIIAVDASLGKPESIGVIEVGEGPLYPGAGVKKKLPPVGHIYVSGIVNIGGFMEQMVLQSTRLYQVMELAAIVTGGISKALSATP